MTTSAVDWLIHIWSNGDKKKKECIQIKCWIKST